MSRVTYSPCIECRKLNKFVLSKSDSAGGQPICGQCKNSLPTRRGVNELNASGLLLLVEKSPIPVVVDFWAPGCAPCKSFAPIFEKTAEIMVGEAAFAKVDVLANPLAADTFRVRGVPVLAVFKGGMEQGRQTGAMALSPFVEWIRNQADLVAA